MDKETKQELREAVSELVQLASKLDHQEKCELMENLEDLLDVHLEI